MIRSPAWLFGACAWLAAFAAQADAARVAGALDMVERVCLETWPDFTGLAEAAGKAGLEDWSEPEFTVFGDPDSGTTVTVAPAETLLMIQIFPAQCVVTLLDTPYADVKAGLDAAKLKLARKPLSVTRSTDDAEQAMRSYADPSGAEVHMLVLDLPEDNAVGIAVAPQSYQ